MTQAGFSRPLSPNQRDSLTTLNTDRFFSYAKALELFGSLVNQRVYIPVTSYNVAGNSLVDKSGNGCNMVLNGSAATLTDNGVVSVVETPGDSLSYLEAPDSAQVELPYPVCACWIKCGDWIGSERWFIDKLSSGAPQISYGFGLNEIGELLVRLSVDGTALSDFVTSLTSLVNLNTWNFFAFQYRTTELNIIINDTLVTVVAALPASVYQAGSSPLRAAWKLDGRETLIALSSDSGTDVVSKLLGLFFHSRYAFRNDWGAPAHLLLDLFTGNDGDLLSEHVPDVHPISSAWRAAFPLLYDSGIIDTNSYSFPFDAGAPDESGAAIIDLGVNDLLVFSALVTLYSDEVGFIFRYQDADNYWMALLSTTAFSPNVSIYLVEVNAGVPTIQTSTNGISTATQYRAVLKLIGTNLDFTISDAAGNSFNCNFVSASMQGETEHGLFIHRTDTNAPSIDEFKIDLYEY